MYSIIYIYIQYTIYIDNILYYNIIYMIYDINVYINISYNISNNIHLHSK